MPLTDYLLKAGWVWFMGFFPLFEIYIAIPAGIASGLGIGSVLLWAILGNFTPILLISVCYGQLRKIPSIRQWLDNLVSERIKIQVNRYGTWFVLLITPWVGVWVMSVTAKTLGMETKRFLLASFISITVYALITSFLVYTGIDLIHSIA